MLFFSIINSCFSEIWRWKNIFLIYDRRERKNLFSSRKRESRSLRSRFIELWKNANFFAVEIIVIFHKHVWNFYIFIKLRNIFSTSRNIFSAIIIHQIISRAVHNNKQAWKKFQSAKNIAEKKNSQKNSCQNRMQNAQRLVNKLQKSFFFRRNLKALTAFFYQYALRTQ